MHYGRLTAMPDVYRLPGPGAGEQYLRAPSTYLQGRSGILLDGHVCLYGNCGGRHPRGTLFGVPVEQLPEEEWALVYPVPHPLMGGRPDRYWDLAQWHRLYGPDVGQDETGLVSIVRTPPTWPDDLRWLLLGSCSDAGTWGKAYRVYVGIATSTEFPALFQQAGRIQSVRELPVQKPPNDWWPQGVWCVAGIVLGGRVLVIGRDNGVAATEAQAHRMHVVHELRPDLTSTRVGTITVGGATRYTWLTDAAIGTDGRLYALEGNDPGTPPPARRSIAEYASAGPWVGGDVELVKTGRVFAGPGSTDLPAGPLTWDGGYLRTPEGALAGDLVIANAGRSADPWTRGQWWVQWWTDDPDLAGTLGVEVEPVRLGPTEEGWR